MLSNFIIIDQLIKHMINLTISYLTLNKSYVILPEIHFCSHNLRFNARTTKWWRNDTETTEIVKIDSVTTYGFSQIISEQTHILLNPSSCIDLIFAKPT